jgi:hypothetical protein
MCEEQFIYISRKDLERLFSMGEVVIREKSGGFINPKTKVYTIYPTKSVTRISDIKIKALEDK